MNRTQRRAYEQRLKTEAAAWDKARHNPVAETVEVASNPVLPKLPHNEAREAFAKYLRDAGATPEDAERAAMDASVRCSRRENYSL